MHHIYHIEGFILASQNYGEADKAIICFSDHFGLIKANAQGVRELKSKLRYSLQNYSRSSLSLVRTKNGWRITSARLVSNYLADFKTDRQKFLLMVRISALLRRLLQGEEANRELFEVLSQGFNFLGGLGTEMVTNFEPIFVLSILHRLGYVGDSPLLSKFIEITNWNKEILEEASVLKGEFVKSINISLSESHL